MARYAAAITNLGRTRLRTDRRLLGAVQNRLVHPGRALEQRMQRADELADRLNSAARALLDRAQTTLNHRGALLERLSPARRIDAANEQVLRAHARLRSAEASSRATAESRLGGLARALQAVSPLATLDRGYAIVAKPDGSRWGTPLVSAREAAAGEELLAHLKDGRLRVQVTEVNA